MKRYGKLVCIVLLLNHNYGCKPQYKPVELTLHIGQTNLVVNGVMFSDDQFKKYIQATYGSNGLIVSQAHIILDHGVTYVRVRDTLDCLTKAALSEYTFALARTPVGIPVMVWCEPVTFVARKEISLHVSKAGTVSDGTTSIAQFQINPFLKSFRGTNQAIRVYLSFDEDVCDEVIFETIKTCDSFVHNDVILKL